MPETPESKSRIYVPLRSNAAWFGDFNCRARLERQIKTYLILYDQIVFENGRIHLIVGADGQGMHWQYPGNSYPHDRTKIEFYEPGAKYQLSFGTTPATEHVLLQGATQATYDIDFLPIVHAAGLNDATFIRWSTLDVDGVLETEINSRVWSDSFDTQLCAVLPENRYLRDHVMKGLYRDSIIARHMGVPLSVDEHAIPVLELKQRRAKEKWAAQLPNILFDYWIDLNLPDFSQLPWDDLCEFRESDKGESFRRMVERVSNRVQKALSDATDKADVDEWLKREFTIELIAELNAHVATPGRAIASICLNFIPFGSFIDAAQNISSVASDQGSWVSTIRGYKPN